MDGGSRSPAVVNSYNNLLLLQFEPILLSFHSDFSLGLKPLVSLSHLH